MGARCPISSWVSSAYGHTIAIANRRPRAGRRSQRGAGRARVHRVAAATGEDEEGERPPARRAPSSRSTARDCRPAAPHAGTPTVPWSSKRMLRKSAGTTSAETARTTCRGRPTIDRPRPKASQLVMAATTSASEAFPATSHGGPIASVQSADEHEEEPLERQRDDETDEQPSPHLRTSRRGLALHLCQDARAQIRAHRAHRFLRRRRRRRRRRGRSRGLTPARFHRPARRGWPRTLGAPAASPRSRWCPAPSAASAIDKPSLFTSS